MTSYPYEHPVDPGEVGISKTRLERVVRKFRKQCSSGAFPGGQLVLRRHGKLVLNETCGIRRGLRPSENLPHIPVQPDTPFPALSCGKPLAAIAIAFLEERRLLDVEAPVADIIPGFARHGKGEITILDVLTHRSGVLMPDLAKKPDLWGNREAILEHIVETKPTYKRGTFAYHPFEYGWILAEVCLRLDGHPLPEFVAEEISTPLQLPALRYGLAGRDIPSFAFTYWLGKKEVWVAGVNVAANFEATNNSEDFFKAMNPADSLVTDAATLAAFYEFLVVGGVTHDGRRIVSSETVQPYTTHGRLGWDRSLRTPLTVGRGFILGSPLFSTYGWGDTTHCFGHGGGYSSLAFGDYDTGIAAAIVTNGNRNLMDSARRMIPLAHGLRKACL